MNFSIDTPLGTAIADYTGLTVVALDVVADPEVEGTWAVQTTVANEENHPRELTTLQFLLRGFKTPRTLNAVNATDLEEVEFTTWPPKGMC